MYAANAKFAKVPQVLLDWREHPDRLTRVDPRYSVENFLRAKAHYMEKTILVDRDAVIVWGAGMMGRRLAKQLERVHVPLSAFTDIDPKKIGRTLRRRPIIAVDDVMDWWGKSQRPVILSAVASRGARPLIRQQLTEFGLVEGIDWWCVA
jgi:NADH/NAD ratio-sensing transcriptional regulator Rex